MEYGLERGIKENPRPESHTFGYFINQIIRVCIYENDVLASNSKGPGSSGAFFISFLVICAGHTQWRYNEQGGRVSRFWFLPSSGGQFPRRKFRFLHFILEG